MTFFLDGLPFDDDISFRVWGPDGKEIPPGPRFPGTGAIAAYSSDPAANQEVRAEIRDKDSYTLKPGESVMTSPVVFNPHMIEPTGDRPEDWMKRTNDGASLAHYNELIAQREAQVQKEMADTKPPMPPPGYRPLMAYAFAQPGEYRIQAVYDDVVFVRPRLARIDSLPMLLRLFLELSCEFIGPERTIGDLRSYRVHAESPILGFTVKR